VHIVAPDASDVTEFDPNGYGIESLGILESVPGTREPEGSRGDAARAMQQPGSQKIVPFLWYTSEAEEAARFYASVFPDSRVDRVTEMPADSPSGPPGSVKVVDFTLCGQAFTAMSAGPHDAFNDAISLLVNCDSQEEIDRYWNAILESGGEPQACGWIKDRYGVRWQIVPTRLLTMMADADRSKAGRAAEEMMRQVKLDLARLEAAFEGRPLPEA